MLLPVEDRGGVAGAYEKSVSIGRRKGESWGWIRIVGFWYIGWGEATGVNIWLAYAVWGYEMCEFADDGRWKYMACGWKVDCPDGWGVKCPCWRAFSPWGSGL
jgi:hypothetical protein